MIKSVLELNKHFRAHQNVKDLLNAIFLDKMIYQNIKLTHHL